jgi:hypothetical protein
VTVVTIPEGPMVGAGQYAPTFELVRHIVSFLKWRFSKLPPGSYHYDLTDEGPEGKSEIFIGADTPDPITVGQRPAITVLRSQLQAAGLSLGDRAFIDLATGAMVRMDMYPTNLMINVLSTEPVEAEGIGWFVYEQISAFRDDIVKASKGNLLLIGPRVMISPPSPAGTLVESAENNWIVVVLAFPTYLQRAITSLPLNRPIIKEIDITAVVHPPPERVEPRDLFRGTAVLPPQQTDADRASATGSSADLPQTDQDEAQSSEPLTVEIQTR